jgi:hypothetical protein
MLDSPMGSGWGVFLKWTACGFNGDRLFNLVAVSSTWLPNSDQHEWVDFVQPMWKNYELLCDSFSGETPRMDLVSDSTTG